MKREGTDGEGMDAGAADAGGPGGAARVAVREPAKDPETQPHSPALEAELAALEAMLPATRKGVPGEGDDRGAAASAPPP